MTKQNISRIHFALGKIQGLAEGSGADEQETINACVDEIVEILDDEIQEEDNDTRH